MNGRKPFITLGITGGIAAYKAAELCSTLVRHDFEVQVVMTENATRFVTPLTFRTLSRRQVVTGLWDAHDWKPEHVAAAEVSDLFVVAPCSANFLGKYAHGIADDALTTFAISMRCPALLAPAMNPAMWAHPAVTENVRILRERGVHFVGPGSGRVACGADGVGRMAEPEAILEKILGLCGLPAR